ncbi:uncharacterized protein LOC127858070 [Dreissena polymorpha]|uniref:uncharacterized protein LOC127858070 n=1 Tax=Dreissena polymorpha TaxID=45954 RepID=UPI0022644ED9|nr:uncharacterized protein LOC127858070 [Dreissena polymorpha]
MADNSGADFRGVITTGVNNCHTEIEQMQNKLTQLDNDIKQLKDRLKGLESNIARLQQQIVDLQGEIEKKRVDADKFEKKKNNSIKDVFAGAAVGGLGLLATALTGGAALPAVLAGAGAVYGTGNVVKAGYYMIKEDTCREQIVSHTFELRKCQVEKERVLYELSRKHEERNDLLEKMGKHSVSKVETTCIQKQLDLTQSLRNSGPDLQSTGSEDNSKLGLQLPAIFRELQLIETMPGYALDKSANKVVKQLVQDAITVVMDFVKVFENIDARQAVIDTAKTIETATKNNQREFEAVIKETVDEIAKLDGKVANIKTMELPRVAKKILKLTSEESNLKIAVIKLQQRIDHLQQREEEAFNGGAYGITVMALARVLNTVTFGLTDILSTIGGALAGINLNDIKECQDGRRHANERIGEITVDVTKLETERNRWEKKLEALMQKIITSKISIHNMENVNKILEKLFEQISAFGRLATEQVV